MNLFFWRKNRQIDEFARSLADEFYSHVQPAAVQDYFSNRQPEDVPPQKFSQHKALSRKKRAAAAAEKENTVDRRLLEVIASVQEFKVSQRLGVYGKARLHMTFLERLCELGYGQDVAGKVNRAVLLQTP